MLMALSAVFFAACGKPAAMPERFGAENYTLEKLGFDENASIAYVGGGRIAVTENIIEKKKAIAKTSVVELESEKVVKTFKFSRDESYVYRLLPLSFAGERLVYAVYFADSEHYYGSSDAVPEYFLIGNCTDKELQELRVQSCKGVFSYDCAKYYYPLDNIIYCLDIGSGETTEFAVFSRDSALDFAARADKEGSVYSVAVNPDGGDSYYCHLNLETGAVSNPVFKGSNARNIGEIQSHTVIVKLPDDTDGPLTQQLYLIDNEGEAGTNSFCIDIGTALSTHSHLIESASIRLLSETELLLLDRSVNSSGEERYMLKLGRIGEDFAEFADLSGYGLLEDISAVCYMDDLLPGTGLVAALLDGKLHIINPSALSYAAKARIEWLPYVNLKVNLGKD